MSHLEGLNDAQKEAVLYTEGPLLVLAGAGSGKTRVITHRIVHLIEKGIAPHNILAVTFTNKAAKEMRERVTLLTEKHAPSARATLDSHSTLTTFHSLGVRLLREHYELLGIRRHFVIYDRSDSTRAIKKALLQAGYTTKQFEPRRILGMISRAKGDAMTRFAYLDGASSYPEEVASEVWEHYETILKEEQALDFDDLLTRTLFMLRSYPEVCKKLQERYKYIHVDEYQDTNKVQYEIIQTLAGETQNICVVGDIDQCLVANTNITMANGSKKIISAISKGDEVLSNYGSGDLRTAVVNRVYKKTVTKKLTTITTATGRRLTSTAEHIHFAGYRLSISPQIYFVYLMYKKNTGWRIGTSQVYTKGQKRSRVGFIQRLNQEHGDAIWAVDTFVSEQKARISEYTLSLKYQLPTIPFVARKGRVKHGYVHDQKIINNIFSSLDTARGAERLLNDYNLSFTYPHHRPQVSKSGRQNILISLCGDRRGKTPMHRISVAGSSLATKKLLTKHGYSVRPARRGSQNWRFESANKSFIAIRNIVSDLKRLLPEAFVVTTARLGVQESVRNNNSLPCIPASSVRPGMALFGDDGKYDIVKAVKTSTDHKTVYDLDVLPTHNFVANGIFTHNSIYSWRGADIKNVLQFERHFRNAKTILLEENYRSTQTIIAASNDIIKKNQNRVEKNVFTNNSEGEKITVYAGMSGTEEAEFVALESSRLIKDDVSPSSIAVLFRTNFQSRALEEAFLNFGIPYQVLGTKFFERKEIKDILSYLRFALNPKSTVDLARIINMPVRGIGKVTTLKLIEGNRNSLGTSALKKIGVFDEIMIDIVEIIKEKKLSDILKFIMKRSGYETSLKEGGEEELERLENLRELVTLAVRYDDLNPEEACERLLEDAALQSDQDELKSKEEKDAVKLMTVHAAKGLEFPYVFITGLEEGLFPHEKLNDNGDIDQEEERRLFYVALTRAEKKVYLSFAHMRTIFGSQRINVPSSFLTDISEKYLESANPAESGHETIIKID